MTSQFEKGDAQFAMKQQNTIDEFYGQIFYVVQHVMLFLTCHFTQHASYFQHVMLFNMHVIFNMSCCSTCMLFSTFHVILDEPNCMLSYIT